MTDFEFSSAEMDGLEFSSAENELEFGGVGQSPHAELEGDNDRGLNLAHTPPAPFTSAVSFMGPMAPGISSSQPLMAQQSMPMQVTFLVHISGV